MRCHVTVLLATALTVVRASYTETWHTSDPVGLPEAMYVIGIANTDNDPQSEVVYRGTYPDFDFIYHIFALDLVTGEVEEVTNEFYRIIAEPGKEPRLVDVNGDNQYEVLFLAEENPGEGMYWYLYSYTVPGSSSEPGYRRLPGLGLSPATPNPLHKRTTIEYSLPAKSNVLLKVYDAAGRLVRDLSPGAQPAGRHRTFWNADDAGGAEVPAGDYFYILEADGKTLSRSALKLE